MRAGYAVVDLHSEAWSEPVFAAQNGIAATERGSERHVASRLHCEQTDGTNPARQSGRGKQTKGVHA
jgi:hypothetical protein